MGGEESAPERGDIEAAVRAVVDAWRLPDASQALRDQVAAMQIRAFDLQARTGEPTELPEPVEEDPDRLGELDMPALVVAGEFDLPDFRQGPEQLAQRLGNAHGGVIAGAATLRHSSSRKRSSGC